MLRYQSEAKERKEADRGEQRPHRQCGEVDGKHQETWTARTGRIETYQITHANQARAYLNAGVTGDLKNTLSWCCSSISLQNSASEVTIEQEHITHIAKLYYALALVYLPTTTDYREMLRPRVSVANFRLDAIQPSSNGSTTTPIAYDRVSNLRLRPITPADSSDHIPLMACQALLKLHHGLNVVKIAIRCSFKEG